MSPRHGLVLLLALVLTGACAHGHASYDQDTTPTIEHLIPQGQRLQRETAAALVAAGRDFGRTVDPDRIQVYWLQGVPAAIGRFENVDLSDRALESGVTTALAYIPLALEGGTPAGFYALRHRIDPGSNDGTVSLLDRHGTAVEELPMKRVVEEGSPRSGARGAVVVPRGEQPRIEVREEVLAGEGDQPRPRARKKNKTTTYYEREVTLPNGATFNEYFCQTVTTRAIAATE